MKQLAAGWNTLVVLLALATMLGCQGLSSANKASTTTTSNQQNTKPGQLTVTPASISFSNVKVGNNQSQPVTMTNSGSSSLKVNAVTATGAGFSVSGLSLPITLAANQSQAFTVIFAPQSAGSIKGNLAIANTGSTPTVDVPLAGGSQSDGALTANPSSLNFGSVLLGSNQILSETLTNSGGSSVTVTQVNATGTGFSASGLSLPLILGAGQSQSFSVVFAPSSTGSSTGNVAIVSSVPTVNVALTGNGLATGALTPSPSSLGFGNVQVGNNHQLSETLTNSGGSNVSISQATTSGTGFSMSGLNPPLVLTPGQHLTFAVTFAPPSPINYSGSVSVVSDASNPNLAIPLTGAGTPVPQGQLSVVPSSIDFGNVTVGTQATRTGTLNASGAAVTVSSDTVNGSAFALGGLSLPVTIPAGQQVQFTVTFTASANGVASGSISFASDASNSPTIESLTGTGVPPAQHSVNLSWTASTSQDVMGYNIYRGVKSGGPYSKINSVLNASTIYTDTTVVDSQTYYYVTTAVNSGNQESAYSNQAQAVIP
jgi:hypothetical protein